MDSGAGDGVGKGKGKTLFIVRKFMQKRKQRNFHHEPSLNLV